MKNINFINLLIHLRENLGLRVEEIDVIPHVNDASAFGDCDRFGGVVLDPI